MIRFNKNKVRFSVSNLMTYKSWTAAKRFADKVNIDIIVVSYEDIEKAYKTDTWKTVKQILFDIECELYLK